MWKRELTLVLAGLLLLKVVKVLAIFPVLGGLLVLGQILVELLLSAQRLLLIRLFFRRREALPVLADELGDFGKGQIPSFQVVSHFYQFGRHVSNNIPEKEQRRGTHRLSCDRIRWFDLRRQSIVT